MTETSEIESLAGDFLRTDDGEFAGTHLLIDCWKASRLDEIDYMKEILQRCVLVSNATLLHLHCHQFSKSGGLSGVAVLAESHISVHTWPERGFAAFDVFMCGTAQPMKVIDVIQNAFNPTELKVKKILRGLANLDIE